MKPSIVIGWKIWYGDGSTFFSKQGTWESAPNQDVQVLMTYFSTRDNMGRSCRQVWSGMDYYFMENNIWGCSFDDASMIKGIVKYGKWMQSEDEFDALQATAMEDYSI